MPPRNTRISVQCSVCGTLTTQVRSSVGKYRATCSKACRSELVRRAVIGANNVNYKGMRDVQCANCDAPLKRYPCHADKFEHFYCNAKCQGEWREKTGSFIGAKSGTWTGGSTVATCSHCSTPLIREKNILRRRQYHFCDRDCYAGWLSANWTGTNSPSWKGGWQAYYGPDWHPQKRKARERDNHTCQHCGRKHKKGGRHFDVHHIQPFRTFGYKIGENEHYKQANDLANLVTLCGACHKLAEHGKIPLQLNLL